jgi:hypothetical protein
MLGRRLHRGYGRSAGCCGTAPRRWAGCCATVVLGIDLSGAITPTVASFLVATQHGQVDGPLEHLHALVRLRDTGVVTADEFGSNALEVVRRL